MGKWIAGIVFAVVAGALTYWMVKVPDDRPDFLVSANERFCRMCERAIADQSPGTSDMVRISCPDFRSAPVKMAEYLRWLELPSASMLTEQQRYSFDMGRYSFRTTLRFTLRTSRGNLVTRRATCEVDNGSTHPPLSFMSGPLYRINGKTYSMWLDDQN